MITEKFERGALPHVVIDPAARRVSYDLRELWEYRELLWYLAWRDISVRYKQAMLGASWVVLQPFMMMLTMSVFFSFIGRKPWDNLPYPLFLYPGLLIWQCFNSALTRTANSLVSSRKIVTKIYFPRIIIPLSNVLPPVLDLGYAFIIFIGMLIYYQHLPTWNVLWFPLFLLLALVTALGVGLWLAIWNIKYRDIQHLLPVLTQMWMFASPVMYPAQVVPEGVRNIYGLNPMVGVVEGFRWALLDAHTRPGGVIFISAAMSLLILISGIIFFRRSEKYFADVI